MQKTSTLLSYLLTALLFSLTATNAIGADTQAANDDANKPVEVTADKLVSQEQKGESVYTGHVIITQGTTVIKGDKVTLHHPERKLSKAIVVGEPATFKRFLPEEQNWVKGHADKITYDTEKKTVLLEGDAYVNQEDKNSISGPKIYYDLTEKTLSAYGNREEKQRVKVIFQPEEDAQKDAP